MLNSEGKCFTFDSRGSGYGRGEGVATVIIKRLKDAVQDGDTVHAVIRNSGANQDGKTLGVTLPNPDAQEALIRSVYAGARLDPSETLYVEAHGTGTVVGDKAEVQALSNIFTQKPRPRNLYVGSVKTNIGHLEATSGLAGLIKAILVLKKKQIPPNLNFIKPKPGLMLDERQISVSSILPSSTLDFLANIRSVGTVGASSPGSRGRIGGGQSIAQLIWLRWHKLPCHLGIPGPVPLDQRLIHRKWLPCI